MVPPIRGDELDPHPRRFALSRRATGRRGCSRRWWWGQASSRAQAGHHPLEQGSAVQGAAAGCAGRALAPGHGGARRDPNEPWYGVSWRRSESSQGRESWWQRGMVSGALLCGAQLEVRWKKMEGWLIVESHI